MSKKQKNTYKFLNVADIDEIIKIHHNFLSELKNEFYDIFDAENVAKDLQDLTIFNNYLNFLKNNDQTGFKLFQIGNEFFDFMVDYYGFNNFPEIVEDTYYNDQQNMLIENFEDVFNNSEYFRGQEKFVYHANLFCDYDYHHGFGSKCNGIYATTDLDFAKEYTVDKQGKDIERITRFKLAPSDIISETFLYNYVLSISSDRTISYKSPKDKMKIKTLKYFLSTIPDYQSIYLFLHIETNLSIIALLLGYDCVNMEGFSVGNVVSILNRSKMVISQSEFDRICKKTKIYNDGTIDHKKKLNSGFSFEK